MRKVFSSHDECIRRFASLSPDERFTAEGRAGNVFFEQGTLYSYGRHFAIAKYIDTPDGVAVLITTDTYSVSTSKHQSIARSALRGHRVLYVPRAGRDIEGNIHAWRDEAVRVTRKLERARKPEIYQAQLQGIESQARAYCTAIGLIQPELRG